MSAVPRPGPRGMRRLFDVPRLVGFAVLAALTILKSSDPTPLARARLALFDRAIAEQAAPRPSQVVIVDIDEDSLRRVGQWPWSRAHLARLVDAAREAGAVALGFDIVFAEPDRLSPPRIAREIAPFAPALAGPLAAGADTDQLFAEALGRFRVVLGRSGLAEPRGADAFAPHLPIAMIGGDSGAIMPHYPGLLPNLPVLEQAAAGVGLFSILPEPDGVVRRVPLVARAAGQIQPALAIELLRVATGGEALAVKRDAGGITGLVINGLMVPTEPDGRAWVRFAPLDRARYLSAADLVEGRVANDALKDKLVLVGTSAIGLQDIKSTPLEPAVPGVEVHAQLIDTILSGDPITRPRDALGLEVLAGLALGGIIILLVPRLGPLPVLGLGLALGIATWQAGRWLFVAHGLLVDVVYPLVAGFAVYATLVFANYLDEARRRRGIRTAFQHYLAPSLVEKLAQQPDLLRLGGETRELTILFSDVRGFTAVAEALQRDPQALTALINRLLSPLAEAVTAHGGTIDKFMGDAIMAFWNAPLDDPDHAIHAAEAALDMRRRLAALEAGRKAEADARGEPFLPLEIGIGINTGPCVVGNMGSAERFDYTALGDAVNLASRLEGLTAQYGAPILVGEATAARLAGRFALNEIDRVAVKGRSAASRIFALGAAIDQGA